MPTGLATRITGRAAHAAQVILNTSASFAAVVLDSVRVIDTGVFFVFRGFEVLLTV